EIARDILPENGSNGWDYVLIGRKDLTAELNLNFMAKELKEAVNQLNSIT
ncbi:MAG: ribonuclease P protein component, partial [Rhodobacteraceae bacterium]|nr:ribonuclease P protein component [Paracoccaceae bacterium]